MAVSIKLHGKKQKCQSSPELEEQKSSRPHKTSLVQACLGFGKRSSASKQAKPAGRSSSLRENSQNQEKPKVKIKRQRSFDNLVSLFRRKSKDQGTKDVKNTTEGQRNRSGSEDLTLTMPRVPVVKVERHHSDVAYHRRNMADQDDQIRNLPNQVKKDTSKVEVVKPEVCQTQEGYLEHKCVKKWEKVWCVIKGTWLYGFSSEEHEGQESVLKVNLQDCTWAPPSGQEAQADSVFCVRHFNARNLYFKANSHEDTERWMKAVKSVTSCATNFQNSPRINQLSVNPSLSSSRSRSRSPSLLGRSMEWFNRPASPSPHMRSRQSINSLSCLLPASSKVTTDNHGQSETAQSPVSTPDSNTEVDLSKYTRRGSRHDVSLQEAWRSMKNINNSPYVQDDCRSNSLYNTSLPGPGNEGLIVLQDTEVFTSDHVDSRKVGSLYDISILLLSFNYVRVPNSCAFVQL